MSKINVYGFTVTEAAQLESPTHYNLSIDKDSMVISDPSQKTAFDLLCDKEETQQGDSNDCIRYVAMTDLLRWLFTPTHDGTPPNAIELAKRLYTAAIPLTPDLVGGLSLEAIGNFFNLTRAAMSRRVLNFCASIGIHNRNSKSPEARQLYSELTKHNWNERKKRERRIKRLQYQRKYREANRETKKLHNKEYYRKNKVRILNRRRAKCPR